MRANLDAITLLQRLQEEDRAATDDELRVLARWSSWGAVAALFDEQADQWETERRQLRAALDESAYKAARRTTINAHYTDPAYVLPMWDLLSGLGFTEGEVLEPGCGAGTFIGLAPPGARMTGIELDPTSAAVAAALYPEATVRTESFADTRFPAGHFDAAIGNVPFGDIRPHDPRHNAGRHTLHNRFIIKSLGLTRPGGMVALLTSHFTLDAQNPAARREMNALADLVAAVRLPTGAHRRAAGGGAKKNPSGRSSLAAIRVSWRNVGRALPPSNSATLAGWTLSAVASSSTATWLTSRAQVRARGLMGALATDQPPVVPPARLRSV